MNAQNIPLYYNIFFALFSAITQVMKHGAARFRAFGNIADVLMKMENLEEANGVYQKQLILSKQSRDKRFEASAFGSLGVCQIYRTVCKQPSRSAKSPTLLLVHATKP